MNSLLRRFNLVILLPAILIICAVPALSQDYDLPTPPDWDPVMGAPHGPSEWEKAHEGKIPPPVFTDDPPPSPAVNPAEWERMTGVLIRYPLGISTSIVAEMSEDVVITTIVSSSSQQSSVYNMYQSAGVNMANTDWLIAPSNSMWTRDYGPWFIFTGDNEQGISNHTYNRPYRPDDNMIPVALGQQLGIPVYDLPLIHTGGNHMSDGVGTSMSTVLVYDENPSLSQAQVDQYMFDWLGNDYDVVPDILSSGIHHIDCWAKMLNPGTILAKRLSPPNSTLEANVAYWESQISPYGKPYEVVRVDCYSSTPYTNSLILNDKVLVPLFGSDLDDDAMQTYQDAMPGYEILGYTGSWVSDDAIHCRTMGITDRYMLRITHVPLLDRENNGQDYPVEAIIHAYSNQPLSAGSPEILWRLEGGGYSSALMTNQGGDIYIGYIPEQANFSTIEYYIHAEDLSGRSENHPFIGAPDPHQFNIYPDTEPPVITHQPLSDLSLYEWPPIITAQVTDNTGIDEVYVEYSINGTPQTNVSLTPVGNIYSGQLDGTVVIGDTYEYRIVAVDISQNANTAYDPPVGMYGGEIVPAYLEDMEYGAPDWSHSIVLPGFNDQWHLSTRQNHTSGGSYSYKCGDTGTGSYGNLLDAGLVSAEYPIDNGSRLSFWHIMSAEISSSYPGYAYDGGLVEISVNGGNWNQITPTGGYPYLVRTGSTPGPFVAETEIFSGETGGWEEVSFDLTGYEGNVRFRFRFGSDGSAGETGWYIDDVLVVVSSGSTPALDIELTYQSGSPVPSGGGNLYFDVFVENYGTVPLDYDAWLEVVYEGGTPTTVVQRSFSNYLPGWTINRPNMYYPVPGSYAAGNYTFTGKVGVHPDVAWDVSGFPFVKDGVVGIAEFQPFVPDGVPNPFDEIEKGDAHISPTEYTLLGAYPNPFNPVTAIGYQLSGRSFIKLSVYDISGRLVSELVDTWQDAGIHEAIFDASTLASGIYLYHFEAEYFTASGKMVLMK